MGTEALAALEDSYQAVILQSFGVGGLPGGGSGPFAQAVERWLQAGKTIVMLTQVPYEGSDMAVYQVGYQVKEKYRLLEGYNMTLEAAVTKLMWVLGRTGTRSRWRPSSTARSSGTSSAEPRRLLLCQLLQHPAQLHGHPHAPLRRQAAAHPHHLQKEGAPGQIGLRVLVGQKLEAGKSRRWAMRSTVSGSNCTSGGGYSVRWCGRFPVRWQIPSGLSSLSPAAGCRSS